MSGQQEEERSFAAITAGLLALRDDTAGRSADLHWARSRRTRAWWRTAPRMVNGSAVATS